MRTLVAVALVAVFYIFQQFRFLDLYGVNPNLLLVALLFFALWTDNFRFLGILLAVSAVLALIFTPAWFFQVLVVLAIVIAFYAGKSFITGSRFLDFLLAIFLGTLLFYLAVNLFRFDLPYVLILREVFYNLAVGILMWYGNKKITS